MIKRSANRQNVPKSENEPVNQDWHGPPHISNHEHLDLVLDQLADDAIGLEIESSDSKQCQ